MKKGPAALVFDTGIADRIHSWFARLKMDISAGECKSIIDEMLKALDEPE